MGNILGSRKADHKKKKKKHHGSRSHGAGNSDEQMRPITTVSSDSFDHNRNIGNRQGHRTTKNSKKPDAKCISAIRLITVMAG